MRYYAEIDPQNVVLRVVVAETIEWCQTALGGEWVETVDPYSDIESPRYCGPDYRWDSTYQQFFPWTTEVGVGTLWCLASSWDAVDTESQQAYLDSSGLTTVREVIETVEYVVFGGRTITEQDQIALTEVI